MNYQVIEDNAGGMYLFFFDDDGNVILGLENIEYCQPGDLEGITFEEARTWESQFAPVEAQEHYDSITSFDFGWTVVADQDGINVDEMGRAAQIVFGIEAE